MRKIWRIFSFAIYILLFSLSLLNIWTGVSYPRLFVFLSIILMINLMINGWVSYKDTKVKAHLFTIIMGIIGAIVIFIMWQNNDIVTSKIDYTNSDLPGEFNGYKIVHISDLHNKEFGSNQHRLLDKISDSSPDIIVVTGDLIDRRKYDLDTAILFIEGARKIAPVYYVSGNHEAWSGDFENIKHSLLNAGVEIIDDRKIQISKEGSNIEILGLSDPAFLTDSHRDQSDLSNLQANLKQLKDPSVFQILLCHRPELFQIYVEEDMDLIFAGHAHGGQVRLPFIGGIVAPNQGFFPQYTSGAHHENNSTMIVSRGLGNSIVPIRVFNRPEIVVLTLKNR